MLFRRSVAKCPAFSGFAGGEQQRRKNLNHLDANPEVEAFRRPFGADADR